MRGPLAIASLLLLGLPAACGESAAGESCRAGREPQPLGSCFETAAACGSRFEVAWSAPIEGSYRLAVEIGDVRLEATCPGEAGCGATVTCDAAGFVLADEVEVGKIGALAALADEPLYWELRDGDGLAAGTVPSVGTEVSEPNGPGCAPRCVSRTWTTSAR